MEKPAANRTNRHSRLLAAVFCLCSTVCIRVPAEPETEPYILNSQSGFCFKGNESTVQILIPGKTPAAVRHTQAALPKNVQLVSMQKKSYSNETYSQSVLIELTYRFSETGVFQLPPVIIQAGLKKYTLTIKSITVRENPAVMKASLFWYIPDKKKSLTQGEPFSAELRITYAQTVRSLVVPLETGLIIEQISDNTAGNDFADASALDGGYTLAVYRITPLAAGTTALPKATAAALGTNSQLQQLETPRETLAVIKQTGTAAAKTVPQTIFADAFADEASAGEEKQTEADVPAAGNPETQRSAEEAHRAAKNLADLRKKERRAIFQNEIAAERESFEAKLGLAGTEPEYPVFVFYLLALLVPVETAVFIFVCRRKHRNPKLILLVTCIIIATGLYLVKDAKYALTRKGVFTGGNVRLIPDSDSSFSGYLPCGTTVTLEKQTSGWSLIRSGKSFTGWIPADELYVIDQF